MIINDFNYKVILLKYINTKINTNLFVKLFATDKQYKYYLKTKRLNTGDRDNIIKRANKFCKLEGLGKGKYIIYEILEESKYKKYYYLHPLYTIYHGMKQRCYNPNFDNYYNYGGRGITICNEWLDKENGLLNFIKWSENNGYIPNQDLSIDRIDNDKGYSPDNCRWTTRDIQALNRRNVKRNLIGMIDINEYNNLLLCNYHYKGKSYPLGTFLNLEDAEICKDNLLNILEKISFEE